MAELKTSLAKRAINVPFDVGMKYPSIIHMLFPVAALVALLAAGLSKACIKAFRVVVVVVNEYSDVNERFAAVPAEQFTPQRDPVVVAAAV